jgi:hypothetical protein
MPTPKRPWRTDSNEGADGRLVGLELEEFLSVYHNKACGFSVADGHSEIQAWPDSRTPTSNQASEIANVPRSVDWEWVASHATARKDGQPIQTGVNNW